VTRDEIHTRGRNVSPTDRSDSNYIHAHVENAISDSERMGSRWLAKITFLIERTLVTSD